jgi:hypothetical protein
MAGILTFLTFNFLMWHIYVTSPDATYWMTVAAPQTRSGGQPEVGCKHIRIAEGPVRLCYGAPNASIRTILSRASRVSGKVPGRRGSTSGVFFASFSKQALFGSLRERRMRNQQGYIGTQSARSNLASFCLFCDSAGLISV